MERFVLCKNFEKHIDRVESAIKEFDLKNISTYTSIENTISGGKSPAILLDALSPVDLDEDVQDLATIRNTYRFRNATWHFSSDYIIENLFDKFGTEADIMVESMYYALGSDFNRTFGPAIGRLFERCAVKSGFITRHGLICKSVDKSDGEQVILSSGKECKAKDFPS